MVRLLHEAGVPRDVLALCAGEGETVGAALVADARTAGVVFTGSTDVARAIARALAADRLTPPRPLVPLIAETGGINAMIVDSTALPEQVVDAVVMSAFRLAGQRCSALRLLCLHAATADAVLEMLRGAVSELVIGDPADPATDVGPVIDAAAKAQLDEQLVMLDAQRDVSRAPKCRTGCRATTSRRAYMKSTRWRRPTRKSSGRCCRSCAGAATWKRSSTRINALGFGLTLGVQTRVDGRAERIAACARVGNVYVNRSMIGAVVGVQPFGGEGLSGTGPKAGGPHYLARFCVEQTITINTAAAGGNVALLSGAVK